MKPPPTPPGRLLVPLYVHPTVDPLAWQALRERARQLYAVVLNRADGPGRHRDPHFRATAHALRAAGVRLLGYVDTDYGRRPPRAVLADVWRHRRWYGVDGVFYDQSADHAAHLPRYRALVRGARLLGARTAVLNPGTHPHPGYADIADVLVTFEGHWRTYQQVRAAGWTARHPSRRFCHLVYGVPEGQRGRVARTAYDLGAALHCAVPGEGSNPWRYPPSGGSDDMGENG
ncbi:spherulation-specific family 4 protein [Streptomyces sp. 796.1]|uniref:spherulation-specific family 4 protein n=1 Tax=Streptomyces sp. 796.1 TaxID=3163029 RepID=UPI0039C8EBC7